MTPIETADSLVLSDFVITCSLPRLKKNSLYVEHALAYRTERQKLHIQVRKVHYGKMKVITFIIKFCCSVTETTMSLIS